MRIAPLVILLLLSGAGAATAADAVQISPNIDPARFGWTGFYVGATGGYGRVKDIDYAPPAGLTPPFYDSGQDWIFGGYGGYLHQFGNFVVGGEAEALSLDIAYKNFSFISVQNSYSLKARAGYAIDRFLITGHVGGVYATTNYLGWKDWGLEAGAGIDYALTDHIVLGGQYSHYRFTNFDGTQINANVDLIKARIGVKF